MSGDPAKRAPLRALRSEALDPAMKSPPPLQLAVVEPQPILHQDASAAEPQSVMRDLVTTAICGGVIAIVCLIASPYHGDFLTFVGGLVLLICIAIPPLFHFLGMFLVVWTIGKFFDDVSDIRNTVDRIERRNRQ